ncbi:MAG: hypothetical protein JWP75_2973 [Frondihabitans sp.]|nr:hypothetical protein [Frondihabitans sp.]
MGSGYNVQPPTTATLTPASIDRIGSPDLAGPPSGATLIEALQQGYYGCVWSGANQQLQLSVLPDATTAFEAEKAHLAKVAAEPGPYAGPAASFPKTTFGTDSFGGCASNDPNNAPCQLNVLNDSIWIQVSLHASPVPGTPAAAAPIDAKLVAAAKSAIAAIAATGAKPTVYTEPTSVWSSVTTCSQFLDTTASSGKVLSSKLDLTDAYQHVFSAAIDRADGIGCYGTNATVFVVPGAAWVEPIAYSASGFTSPVTLSEPGVTDSRYVCPTSGTGCWAEGVIDHALVVVAGGSQQTGASTLGSIASKLGVK